MTSAPRTSSSRASRSSDAVNALLRPETERAHRVRARFAGRVQGVGFRPFVYRLALRLGVSGGVYNDAAGAVVEAEGSSDLIRRFFDGIERQAPAPCRLVKQDAMAADGSETFEIAASRNAGELSALAMPDRAPCAACLAELYDPASIRYRYPFIACTDCGPRYSVLESLPFDRERTSMRAFPLAGTCRREFEDPRDRRFHAQMNAAPGCGPQLALWSVGGAVQAAADAALIQAGDVLRGGGILALKGVGGFQLCCDARNEQAVSGLRERKAREAKPFAVMVAGVDAARRLCRLSRVEADTLASPEAPIVLLERREYQSLAPSVAPGLSTLGLMMPASPLHHLLAAELGFALVATSGNLAGEPLCTGNAEALERLGCIADAFLVHDRDIVRALDDSVIRVIGGRPVTLRLGRGLAPLPHALPAERGAGAALALGAHVKAAPALGTGGHIVLGQHVGDLDSGLARQSLAAVSRDMCGLFMAPHAPVGTACDAHPDYASTRLAEEVACRPLRVWHHQAHILACQLDNGIEGGILGVAWDGTGLGPDGTLWGGEFLQVDGAGFARAAHLRRFRLPGGEAAIREPLRVLACLLDELYPGAMPAVGPFADEDLLARARLWARLPGPETSSAGRLFDAAAALLGLCRSSRYEGEAAMRLEAVADRQAADVYEPGIEVGEGSLVLDWAPLLRGMLADLDNGVEASIIAARFHHSLGAAIAGVAARLGADRVALTGGCFQNRLLCEAAIDALRGHGIEPVWHHRIPPNDGGIAAGQALAAWHAAETCDVPGRSR